MIDKKKVISTDEQNFAELISKGKVLIDFWAEWCMPCRMQTPILEKFAEKMNGEILIAKVNIDENPSIAQNYGITGIPTLMLFQDGQPVRTMVGVQNERSLTEAVQFMEQ